jgi:2-polyprenyl-3-methyl-5-hydroxy-6-metoxy-1,4-benzoquinol methylase
MLAPPRNRPEQTSSDGREYTSVERGPCMGFERFAPVERRIDINGRPLSVWRPPDMEALIDLVAFDEDERIPYWADVWESAIVLAEDLAAVDGKGLTLLELGCGLGLPSLAAARTGFTVTATDYESPALEGVRYNAARNGLETVTTRELDWRKLPEDLGRYDRVVAADVLYESHHPAALADVIARTLKPDGLALVADPCRQKAAGFEPAARAAGLGVIKQRARRPHGATDGPAVEIYCVTFPG